MTDKLTIIPNRSTGEIGIILADGGHFNLTEGEALVVVAKIVNAISALRKSDADPK